MRGTGSFFNVLNLWRAKEEQQKQVSSFDPVSVPKTRGHEKKNMKLKNNYHISNRKQAKTSKH